ncbi:MAG: biotin/lipoate A/B protein ligase family protein [Actinomycetota bacterium]|nr:biotin/lipoate A/B protein ligase family protein [Actinomycetota bacterium]
MSAGATTLTGPELHAPAPESFQPIGAGAAEPPTSSQRIVRLLTDDGVSAKDGLALDEALMRSHGSPSVLPGLRGAATSPGRPDDGCPPPTVRLYTYADHCALVGRYQNVDAEVDMQAAADRGLTVARRPTGGGAILMGAQQLGVAVVSRANASERPRTVLARMAQGVVKGLALAGVEATFKGKNDLEVDGRKIAGLGLYSDGKGALLFHASVLAGLDIELMLSVLRIPASKLGRKGVATVADRVTTLSDLTGEPWDGARLRPLVAAGFEDLLGSPLEPSRPSDVELSLASDLAESKYGSDAWTRERHASRDAVGTSTAATAVGTVSCQLALQGDVIKSALLGGDFNVMPSELMAAEKALRWQRVDSRILLPRLEKALEGSSVVAPASLLDAVLAAAADASQVQTAVESAAPRRTGSCYFPEVSR